MAICESRKAYISFADGGRTPTAILATVGAQRRRFTRIINLLTQHLVHKGVTQNNCFPLVSSRRWRNICILRSRRWTCPRACQRPCDVRVKHACVYFAFTEVGPVAVSGCEGKESLAATLCCHVSRVWVGCCRGGEFCAFNMGVVQTYKRIATPQSQYDGSSASRESCRRIAVMSSWCPPCASVGGDARAH